MTRNELNELSIFALREFARRTGVYAPTSKKKNELIDEIIEISEGRKMPHIAKTKQGRPPKNYGYPFVESFVGTTNFACYPTQCVKQETQFTYDDDIKMVNGYLEIGQHSSLIWSFSGGKMQCLQISKELVEKYNLRSGDLVLAEFEKGENGATVTGILNINNVPVDSYDKSRKNYQQIEHKIPQEFLPFANIKFQDLNIKLGESVYLYGASNLDNSLTMVEMLNSCNADRKLYVNTSIVEKNRFMLNELSGVEQFVCEFTDSIDDARRAVILATDRAKRVLEKGETCVLAVDDVQAVRGVDVDDLHITKNLMSLTKNGANGGSVTLLAIMPLSRSMDLFEKLADKRFKVLDRKLFLLD